MQLNEPFGQTWALSRLRPPRRLPGASAAQFVCHACSTAGVVVAHHLAQSFAGSDFQGSLPSPHGVCRDQTRQTGHVWRSVSPLLSVQIHPFTQAFGAIGGSPGEQKSARTEGSEALNCVKL